MSPSNRYDQFTERARKVLTLAQEEAQRFNHHYLGTEHLLLGLVREGEGVAGTVLCSLGVELIKVHRAVQFFIGRGEQQEVGEIGLTPRAKKAIELAVDEARRLGHHYIGTGHLLLGLLRVGDGIAVAVLESLAANLARVRYEVIHVLTRSGPMPRRDQLPPIASTPLSAPAMRVPENVERFDALTGLFNRHSLFGRLEEERPRKLWGKRNVSVMYVDIDRFREVNDGYGHAAGDAVLREFADLLRTAARPEDMVARIGGEEFAVLFLPEMPVTGAEQVADQLRARVQNHIFVKTPTRRITLSVGLTCFLPEDVRTEVLTRADAAMWAVKRRGGNGMCFHDGTTLRFYGPPES